MSSKGQIVLPGSIRRKLGLRPGDSLDLRVRDDKIVLVPQRGRRAKSTIVRDAVTGLPVLTAGLGAPQLTSEQVQEILSNFP
jgi:AbrB family looped-hinge helix DNA binding protein